jgi:hypothetical protein
MSMEKQGVCEGENTAPEPQKAAQDCPKEACCGNACGTDMLSKAAEAVAAARGEAVSRNGIPVTKHVPPL